MRTIIDIAWLELRRRLADRSLVIQGVVGPIALAAIVGFAFAGGDSGSFTVELAIVADADDPVATSIVDGLIESTEDPDGLPAEITVLATEAEAREAVDDGSLDAAIVLPPGFALGTTDAITVFSAGDRRISGDLAEAVALQIAASVDSAQLAAVVAGATGGPLPDGPLTGALVDESPVGDDDFDAITFFAPSMAILFLFFTIGAGARSILRERTDGTLQRVQASPIPDSALLAGKALSSLAAGFVTLVIVWVVTSLVFGANWGDAAGVIAVIVGAVVAVTGISAVLAAVAGTDQQAESYTSFVAFALALIGGNFVSPGSLPPLFQQLSLLTPNGWALDAFTELSAGNGTIGDVLPAVGVLVAMGIVAGVFGLRRLALVTR